jgi:hypothetical protein
MSIQSIRKNLQLRLDKAGEYWIDRQPADLGNWAGVVEVPNTQSMVYVRVANGQVIEVFNDKAPNIADWKVYIGRDKAQPWLLKIIDVRWVHNISQQVAYILFHHGQHEYPAPDTVWVRRDQFLPLLVLPAGGFNVRLFGDMIYQTSMTAPIRVEDQDIDLSSHAIGAGAKYVLMEVLTDGTLSYVTGTVYESRGILHYQDFPSPSEGAFPIAVFEFYEGQTELRRDSEERSIIDLRMFTGDSAASVGTQINDAGTETVVDNADYVGFWDVSVSLLKKITWSNIKAVLKTYFDTLYATLAHNHDAAYSPIAEPIAAAHISDTGDAHDASAISITDTGDYFTGTDVEAALQELGAGGGGGGVTHLDDLLDVDASSPTDGQALVWDDGTSQWIPGSAPGGGGGADILEVQVFS